MEVLLNICLAIFAGLIIARLLEPLGLPPDLLPYLKTALHKLLCVLLINHTTTM